MHVPSDLASTLAAAVEAGSLDGAARRLHLTQSAVSQRIAALERLLGQAVLVRSRPVRATPAGEAVVRFARHVAMLEEDLSASLGLDAATPGAVRLAVNADSLATWLLPALAEASRSLGIALDLRREDESRTAELLSRGEVVAAVTTREQPIQGCTSTPLGRMTYRAVATAAFVERWLPHGPTPSALAQAPVVDFDAHDDLQSRWLAEQSVAGSPPRHRVPSSSDFAAAIGLSLGWGMLPPAQRAAAHAPLIELGGPELAVALHWQQWRLRSGTLDAVAALVKEAAARELDPL